MAIGSDIAWLVEASRKRLQGSSFDVHWPRSHVVECGHFVVVGWEKDFRTNFLKGTFRACKQAQKSVSRRHIPLEKKN